MHNGTMSRQQSVIVLATNLVQMPTSASLAVVDAGNANPDDDFRFDAKLGPTGVYICNWQTTVPSSTVNMPAISSNWQRFSASPPERLITPAARS
jgi:hypothetical protein